MNNILEIGTRKSGISWKVLLTITLTGGLLYYILISLLDYWLGHNTSSFQDNLRPAITYTLIMLPLMLLWGTYSPRLAQRMYGKIKVELDENEVLLAEGLATFFRGRKGIGGKLFLSDKRMVFSGQTSKNKKTEKSIPYSDVAELIPRKVNRIVDNGLRVKTRDGNYFDFIVNERDVWLKVLGEQLDAARQKVD